MTLKIRILVKWKDKKEELLNPIIIGEDDGEDDGDEMDSGDDEGDEGDSDRDEGNEDNSEQTKLRSM